MSKKDTATPIAKAEIKENQTKHDPSLNIFQRMIEVQKLVTTVDKNSTVKMSENDRGYKATTHDDVAGALHLPLAQCGVFMLPDIEKYTVSQFDKANQWGKIVTWYRTDMDILVKWINVDKPEEFITSKGASFALDTSDKSFAKAYSLALKIVLLKVHLLESRDGEENRPFDEANGGEKAGKGEPRQNNQRQEQGPKPQTQTQEKQAPKDIVYPFESSIKGKKIGDVESATLDKAKDWLKSEMAKEPKVADHKRKAFIYSQVKAVLLERNPTPPPPDDIPENNLNQTPTSNPEDESQLFPPDDADTGPSVDDYEIPKGLIPALDDLAGRPLKKISEGELREAIKIIDTEMKKGPNGGLSAAVGFEVRGKINEFFKSMGV